MCCAVPGVRSRNSDFVLGVSDHKFEENVIYQRPNAVKRVFRSVHTPFSPQSILRVHVSRRMNNFRH